MNRHIAPVLAIIFHFAAASLPAAEPPPAVAALKTAGINVSAMKEGGWNVEVREAKDLDDNIWKQIETLPDMRRFSANGEQFDDAALARLAKIGGIETLFFNGPGITDAGLAALTAMPKLRSFGVDHSTKITGSGLAALKVSANLTAIHFGGCIIGDAGVATLVQLTQLRDVALGHTRITRASFPLLAKLPHLERIEITPNWDPQPYTAADFAAFAPMNNLRELELHDMVLPWENGLAHLAALKSLKTVKLYWCYLADADAAKLKAGLPGVEVDIRNPAGEDRLKQFNERVEKLRAGK